MLICPNCEAEYKGGEKRRFCEICGEELIGDAGESLLEVPPEFYASDENEFEKGNYDAEHTGAGLRTCPNCGTRSRSERGYCSNCGDKLRRKSPRIFSNPVESGGLYRALTKVFFGLLLILFVFGVVIYGFYLVGDGITPPTDSRIAFNIEVELVKNGYENVRAKVTGGRAVLNGAVTKEEDLEIVEGIARRVEGVRQVERRILIERARSDQEIASLVKEDLRSNGFGNIGIKVKDGNVDLNGNVRSIKDKNLILSQVLDIRGVNDIKDNLEITESDSSAETITGDADIPSDSVIASIIRTKLDDKGYKDVGVEVSEGNATLTGELESLDERNFVVSLVGKISEVKQIENNIEIVKSRSDSEIASAILVEFRKRGYEGVQVEVEERTVTLSGEVSNSEERDEAQKISSEMEDVDVVLNNLVVSHQIPDTAQQNSSDSKIDSMIERKLIAAGYNRIGVSVIRGKAILSGKVNSDSEKREIENITLSIPGVENVDNNIDVTQVASSSIDMAIAAKVTRILSSKGYSSIDVLVTNGTVFLKGTVDTHQQHLDLHKIVQEVDGVSNVTSDLEVSEYTR